ncbi:hypothetical protein GIB67_016430 [Kingdonia uniflora]|uniref:Uncharacterized protein n=1 Tax=Kingdonia uniflora TaxID=39325 RepID=A0A7J7MHG2_9MAGN|nr:hypothetical protein GIB67_016430 [Kingdonia uniflora]
MSSSSSSYPFVGLRNLVMVAWHSVYTSGNCGNVDEEDLWFLELYQKHKGQAASFVAHIKEGAEIVARDDGALLLFSGGETRKYAGPRSEAQSYWAMENLVNIVEDAESVSLNEVFEFGGDDDLVGGGSNVASKPPSKGQEENIASSSGAPQSM